LLTRQNFPLLSGLGFPIVLLLHFFILLILLRIVGGRYLQNGINKQIKVGLFMPNFKMQVLINFIESFRVYPFGEVGMLFGPVLKNKFKVWTDSYCFFQ
jgi:hypothetical protein